MADEHVDPSGNTEQFRAFVQAPQEETRLSKVPLLIGALVAAVLAGVVVFLLL